MIENKIIEIYDFFVKKHRRSNMIFIILNIISFSLASFLVVLNLYAIRKNPAAGNKVIMIMFILTSIFSALGAVISSLLSFFVFRKKAISAMDKAERIQKEKELWKNKEADYIKSDRDQSVIEKVLKILKN